MPKKKKGKKVARKKAVRKVAKKRVVSRRKAQVKRAKKTARKTVKKITKKKALRAVSKSKEKVVGLVTHYFPHVRAAVIKMKAPLSLGDKIRIKGHTTDFTQPVVSMQIDRVDIQTAKKGQEIGLLVNSRVRQHDEVVLI
ncbi:MAG: hypothetical protein WCY12_00335 [Candidatus Omnitrophota bacterium]